jgi:hypothetical protein
MNLKILAAGALALLSVTGCASIFEGTSQDITVNTTPPGATCAFDRHTDKDPTKDKPETIGTIMSTPSKLTVRKSKYDITIRCNKAGYQEATYLNHSGVTAMIAGNVAADVILTLGVSSIVDSADGADNKYDSVVNISMVPVVAATDQPLNKN